MEALLGLLFFVFFCIEDQLSWESSSELIKHIRDVMSLFPAFMVLVYSLHQLLYPTKGRILYYLSVLLCIYYFLYIYTDIGIFHSAGM